MQNYEVSHITIKIITNWLVEKKLSEKEFLTAINYLVIHNIIRI